MNCTIYRCKRQDEMYLYLRADVLPESLPETLRKMTGALTEVMKLELSEGRRLARVDVAAVMARLASEGYFIQMPPSGRIRAYENDSD